MCPMRSAVCVVPVVALLFATLASGSAIQAPGNDDLAPFRAISPEQKVRAATFDQPNSAPLRPNETRIFDDEWALPPHDPPDYASFIRDLVCQGDLVVVGRATTKQSFLTESGSSIFTDYAFAAEEYLRGETVFRQPTNDTTIAVSLTGGTIQTPRGPLEARDGGRRPLDFGERYLLFLKRIPKTSSFELSGPHFTVGGGTPSVQSRHELPTALAKGDKSTTTLLADLRAAAATCQRSGGK